MVLTPERPDPSKKSGVNYEKLGKAVEDALILDYIYVLHSTRRQIYSSFVRGVFAGLGGVIGATVGVAVLLALLSLFGGVPVIGHWFTKVGQTIEGGAPAGSPAP
jgi:hypothetical protein